MDKTAVSLLTKLLHSVPENNEKQYKTYDIENFVYILTIFEFKFPELIITKMNPKPQHNQTFF